MFKRSLTFLGFSLSIIAIAALLFIFVGLKAGDDYTIAHSSIYIWISYFISYHIVYSAIIFVIILISTPFAVISFVKVLDAILDAYESYNKKNLRL